MFTRNISKFIKNSKNKFFLFLILPLLVISAHGDPIIENQIDDLNLVISQFVGGQPNALFVMDVSGSMGRNFGGSQVGNWTGDTMDGTLNKCEEDFGLTTDQDRAEASHCAENVANLSVCGSIHCANGTCGNVAEFEALIQCIDNNVVTGTTQNFSETQVARCIYNRICADNNNVCTDVTPPITPQSISAVCNTTDERERAAAALEAAAGLTHCSTHPECSNDVMAEDGSIPATQDPEGNVDTSCNTPQDYAEFKTCMLSANTININQSDNLDNLNLDDNGFVINDCVNNASCPKDRIGAYGSTRLDITLSVIFDLLDADDSLADALCTDDGKGTINNLYNGTSPISCHDYMNTPFRSVRQIARDDGNPSTNRRLPVVGSDPNKLIDYLTTNDADELNIRLRPLTYSGEGNWNGCTSQQTFQTAQGGFAGGSDTAFKNVWRFFRRLVPGGGTPLAYVLGFDDNNGNGGGGGNRVNDDALGVFKVELQTDQAVECRPEFVIVLTDGEDTCSGACAPGAAPSCWGGETTNANRRSVSQAVSNLRTYYARNPFSNQGQQFKKEILTFVIGLGISDQNSVARRAINAMALAGGTSTQGLIQHVDPTGNTIGNVNINDLLPGDPALQPYKDFARALGIDTNPSSAHLQDCGAGSENENGHCHFQSQDILDNNFFDTGAPLTGPNTNMDGFAFFPENAEELSTALQTIFGFINGISTSGTAPAAPQSSTSVALRDRIFVSLLTPITQERLWQGRIALYGFVDDPTDIGNKVVVKKPLTSLDTSAELDSHVIFDDVGGLIEERAQEFHWEAGKILTERNITNDPRKIFTVELDFANSSVIDTTQNGVIRYIGDRVNFDNNLLPDTLGISDSDVLNPIPTFCQMAPPDGFADCNAGTNDCDEDITGVDCTTCVKDCLRDRVVSFISGDTDIVPIGDPLGGPQFAGTTTNTETIGINCPDPTGQDTTGTFDQCAVKLGDVFHSDPIVVGSPSFLFFDTGFPIFARAFRDRSSAVYVGANDGGLHAFHAGELCDIDAQNDPDCPTNNINPFDKIAADVSFFTEGTGWEMFFYVPPTFLLILWLLKPQSAKIHVLIYMKLFQQLLLLQIIDLAI